MMNLATLVMALPAAAVLSAAPAYADDAWFLAEIHSNGTIYPMAGLVSDAQWVATGYQACGQIRGGMSPQAVADASRAFNVYTDPDKMVAALQRHLCPDTL